MNTDRLTLLHALQLVQPGISPKEAVQQSNCFVFIEGRVSTYNDEIAISHPFNIDIHGAVLANELLGLLNKTNQPKLDIINIDGGVSITAGKFKASIKIASEITLPVDEISEFGSFSDLPKDFIEALKFCLFSCSKDMTKPALTCIHAIDDRLESTDNFRITVKYFDEYAYFVNPILVPFEAAKALIKFNVIEYACNKGWLHFRTKEGTVFSCRTYENIKYPDVSRFMDMEGEQLNLPNDLPDVINRAMVFSTTKFHTDERITVLIQKGKLVVKSWGDAGWFEEFCKIRYKGKDKKFEIHPEFFSDIAKLCPVMEIGHDRLRFEHVGGRFIHVISLLM